MSETPIAPITPESVENVDHVENTETICKPKRRASGSGNPTAKLAKQVETLKNRLDKASEKIKKLAEENKTMRTAKSRIRRIPKLQPETETTTAC